MRRILLKSTHFYIVALVLAVNAGCTKDTCSVPLAQVGCAATLEQQTRLAPFGGRGPTGCANAGPCGAYRIWQSAPNLSSVTCVYDSTGERLLSATTCTDVDAFCNDTSNCASGGLEINVSATCDVAKLPMACPTTDAGTD